MSVSEFYNYALNFIESARWRNVKHTVSNRGLTDQLTRVVDNPPLDAHLELLQILTKREILPSIVVDSKMLEGPWTPVAAWIEETPAADGTQAAHPKLYQAFRRANVSNGDGPYETLDGCMAKQSITFYYDQESVIDVPPSTSGIAYAIEGIRRDPETGLYDYALTKTETLEKDVGVYTAHIDQYGSRLTVTRNNLREEVVLDGNGNPTTNKKTFDEQAAQIAQAHNMTTETGSGVIVDVQISKNNDCTADLSIVNTKEKNVKESLKVISVTARGKETVEKEDAASAIPTSQPAVAESHRYEKTSGGLFTITKTSNKPTKIDEGASSSTVVKTLFQSTERLTKENQDDVTGDRVAENPSNGVTVRKDVTLLDNGRFNVDTTTTTELPVSSSIVVKTNTARGLRIETRDENQPEDFTGNIPVGEVWRSEKTQGALFNKNKTVFTPTTLSAGQSTTVCKNNIFEHQHATVSENNTSNPARESTLAGGGETYEKRVTLNDDNTYNIEETKTTEKEVLNAVVDSSANATSTVDTVTHVNVTEPLANVTTVGGDGAIYSRKSQKTPGGRYQTTETRVRPIFKLQYYSCAESYNGSRQHGCIFYNATETQVANLASSYVSISFRLNDHGLYDGNAATTNPPYRSGAAYPPPIETFDQYTYTVSSRIVAHGDKTYTAVVFRQIHSGVVYDSNITQDSANSPYTRVNGHQDWRVNHHERSGEGYWTYYGVNWSEEVWIDGAGIVVHRGKEVGTRNTDVELPGDEIWSYI